MDADAELEENENRKDFTERERGRTFKAAKQIVEDVRKAEEVLGQNAQKPKPAGPKGGRPQKAITKDAVAEAVGETRRTVERSKKQVALAEQYPFMQAWKQSHVLAVGEALEKLPESERDKAVPKTVQEKSDWYTERECVSL